MRDNADIKYNSSSLLSHDDAASLLGSAFHPQDSRGEDKRPEYRPAAYTDSPINSPITTGPPPQVGASAAGATDSSEHHVLPHRRPPPRRQSSLSQPGPDGQPKTPRTSNRVRFAEGPEVREAEPLWDAVEEGALNGHATTAKSIQLQNLRQDGRPVPKIRANDPFSPNSPRSPGFPSPSGAGDGKIRPHPVQRAWLQSQDPLAEEDNEDEDTQGLLGGGDVRRIAAAHGNTVAQEVKSGIWDAFFNMANSIIGAGIIGQPYAFKQAGLLTGIILLVGLTILVDWTIRLIVLNSKLSGTNSFQSTMEHCFGKPGLIAISLAQWAFAFGGMVAFCVIVGDTIPAVLKSIWPQLPEDDFLWIFSDRRFIIILLIGGISYPLSLYRDIAKLAKASTLALISMLVIIVTVLTQGAMVASEERGDFSGYLLINGGVFQAIGVISFAFVCHHNSLLIYGSLHTPTMDRFAIVTHASTAVSMFACLAMALGGFLSFGSKTVGNVLNNFPPYNVMVNIARLCFGLNMLTTLPLEAFVCREVMLNYFWPHEDHQTPGNSEKGPAYELKRHVLLTTGLVAGALGLSLLTCDLGAVFELIGATSACALAYILPPACFLKLSSKKSKSRWLCWACIAFGVGVMVISTIQAVLKLINGSDEAVQCS